MKKAIFWVAAMAFSAELFGQEKIWFLSAEVASGLKTQNEFYRGDAGATKGPKKMFGVYGLGCRVHRSSNRLFQPEFGVEFQTINNAKTTVVDFVGVATTYQRRQVSWVADFCARLESKKFMGVWSAFSGLGLAISYPFLEKWKVNDANSGYWQDATGDQVLGFSFSAGASRPILNGKKRIDFGFHFLRLGKAYYFGGQSNQFKFRASISIDKVEKSR